MNETPSSNLPAISGIRDLALHYGIQQGTATSFVVFSQEFNLSLQDCAEVMAAIVDHRASLATFKRFMAEGDVPSQVIFYLQVRHGLRTLDDSGDYSLEAIRKFYRRFRGVSEDAGSVVAFLDRAHELLSDKMRFEYLWQTLDFITKYIPESYELSYPETVLNFIGAEED